MKKIITHLQKDEWIDYIKKSHHTDFYYSWIYHSLDVNGEPLMFIYENEHDFIAFPLIKRKIPNTDLYDCTCVYGYSGPLSNKPFSELCIHLINNFKCSFVDFLRSEGIVSVFSTLHPLSDQNVLLNEFGGVHKNGRVVAINLTGTLDDQRSQYQMRWFRRIKQLKRRGFYLKESFDRNDIPVFAHIYRDNMRRVNASENYIFQEDYFLKLIDSQEIDCRLFLIYNTEGIAVSGGLMVFSKNIVQAHLLATLGDYLNDSPAKLLIDEVSILARDIGCKYFNLGSGFKFREDTLFTWKNKFSNFTPAYYTWRYIVDEQAYYKIVLERGIDPESQIDHFPLYRLKVEEQLVANN